jgi:hypothetical protein
MLLLALGAALAAPSLVIEPTETGVSFGDGRDERLVVSPLASPGEDTTGVVLASQGPGGRAVEIVTFEAGKPLDEAALSAAFSRVEAPLHDLPGLLAAEPDLAGRIASLAGDDGAEPLKAKVPRRSRAAKAAAECSSSRWKCATWGAIVVAAGATTGTLGVIATAPLMVKQCRTALDTCRDVKE